MGMCKGCSTVYSALIMKDGYCKDCKPELFTEIEINQIDNYGMIGIPNNEISNNEAEKPKVNKNLIISLSIIVVSIISYFIYDFITTPSSSTVKELASHYKYQTPEKIKILKSYEDKGKIVYVLEIYGYICEMPVIKTSSGWSATGMSCTR